MLSEDTLRYNNALHQLFFKNIFYFQQTVYSEVQGWNEILKSFTKMFTVPMPRHPKCSVEVRKLPTLRF